MVEVSEARQFVSAAAVAPMVAAVQHELAVLERAVQRAEAEADAAGARHGATDGDVRRIAAYLEQQAKDADARRRAVLEQGRAAAEQRVASARDEAALLLQEAEVVDLSAARAARRGHPSYRSDEAELAQRYLEAMLAAAPRSPVAAVEVAEVTAEDLDADEVDERFKTFWELPHLAAEEQERRWSPPGTLAVFPAAAVVTVLTTLAIWLV